MFLPFSSLPGAGLDFKAGAVALVVIDNIQKREEVRQHLHQAIPLKIKSPQVTQL